MKLATLTTKTALITTTSVAGAAAAFVLIAPSIGLWPFGDTDVADAEVTREAADLPPSTSPSTPSEAATSVGTGSTTAATEQSRGEARAPAAASASPGAALAVNGPTSSTSGLAPFANKPSGSGSRPGGSGGSTAKGFEIKGSVTGTLYPTVTNDLTVKIENPYSFTIEIVSAAVSVGNSGSCSGRHLWINGDEPAGDGTVALPAGQRVAANGETTYTVTAQLQNSAGDECQNASFPLSYSGKAVKG